MTINSNYKNNILSFYNINEANYHVRKDIFKLNIYSPSNSEHIYIIDKEALIYAFKMHP